MVFEVKGQRVVTLTMDRSYKNAKAVFDEARCDAELFSIDDQGRKHLIEKKKAAPILNFQQVLKNNFKG